MDCAEKIKIDADLCAVPCEGMYAYIQNRPPVKVKDEETETFLELYKNYKKFYDPEVENGILEPVIEPDLKYVRIFFDTPSFDRIKKDRAAKFVDMLSAVGGTMGLLTGFSIISAAEIGYFLGKIIYNFMKSRKQFLVDSNIHR